MEREHRKVDIRFRLEEYRKQRELSHEQGHKPEHTIFPNPFTVGEQITVLSQQLKQEARDERKDV